MSDGNTVTSEPLGEYAQASLVILSESWTVPEIAQAISLEPDSAWNLGDLRPGTRKELRYKNHGVEYTSQLSGGDSRRDHLVRLFERLAPFSESIADLSHRMREQDQSSSVTVWLAHTTHDGTPTYHFHLDDLRFIADIGAALAISVYCDTTIEDSEIEAGPGAGL